MLRTVPNNQIKADVSEALVRFENPTNRLVAKRLAQISRDKSLLEIDLATCDQLVLIWTTASTNEQYKTV